MAFEKEQFLKANIYVFNTGSHAFLKRVITFEK